MTRFLRSRLRPEEGMTLVELSVSMVLLGVVATIFLSVLVSVQKGFERQSSRSQSNDQARLARPAIPSTVGLHVIIHGSGLNRSADERITSDDGMP